MLDDMITPQYISRIIGHDNFDSVTDITLKINTTLQSVLVLGDILKNLKRLNLDGSAFSSVRDLGTDLCSLESLSLNDCLLTDLDGIGILPNLKYLSVQNNRLNDISALAMHEDLEVYMYYISDMPYIFVFLYIIYIYI